MRCFDSSFFQKSDHDMTWRDLALPGCLCVPHSSCTLGQPRFFFSHTLASMCCNDVRQRDSHAANGTFQERSSSNKRAARSESRLK